MWWYYYCYFLLFFSRKYAANITRSWRCCMQHCSLRHYGKNVYNIMMRKNAPVKKTNRHVSFHCTHRHFPYSLHSNRVCVHENVCVRRTGIQDMFSLENKMHQSGLQRTSNYSYFLLAYICAYMFYGPLVCNFCSIFLPFFRKRIYIFFILLRKIVFRLDRENCEEKKTDEKKDQKREERREGRKEGRESLVANKSNF